MLTITFILAIAALICALLSAVGRAPLWVSVILLCIIELIRAIPLK